MKLYTSIIACKFTGKSMDTFKKLAIEEKVGVFDLFGGSTTLFPLK